MTVKLWVFTTNRTPLSLRGNTRRKLARDSNRRATDSPSRNQKGWHPSPRHVRCPVRNHRTFFAARARPRPADFYIIPHFKHFVKQNEPLFQKYFFPNIKKTFFKCLTTAPFCGIIIIQKTRRTLKKWKKQFTLI